MRVTLSASPPKGSHNVTAEIVPVPGEKHGEQLADVPGHVPVMAGVRPYPVGSAQSDQHHRWDRRDGGRRGRAPLHCLLLRDPRDQARATAGRSERAILGGQDQDLVAHAASLQRRFEALYGYVQEASGG